jgi:hypothetical protein
VLIPNITIQNTNKLLIRKNGNNCVITINNVVIDTIIIEQSNELKDRNRVEVSITFRINGNPTLETVTFNVEE